MATIDVLIPAIEKDMGTLPYTIDSIRKHVKHPLGKIYIVSPKSKKLMNLCNRKSCTFVDESTVLPIGKKNIHYSSSKWDRSGWLLQQLLKLNGDKICRHEHFLVMDADTVLIRPHVFLKGSKTVMYSRNWSQPEYFKTYSRLLREKRATKTSFVSHYMLFQKTRLRQLKNRIESLHQMNWYSAIIRNMDKTKPFAFSEFETYGHFVYTRYPENVLIKKSLNHSLGTSIRRLPVSRIRSYSQLYRSLSFHQRKAYYKRSEQKQR